MGKSLLSRVKLQTSLCWQAGCSFSPALRPHHAPRNPNTEKRESYFRGQIVRLASCRDIFHPAGCLWGREKKRKHVTVIGMCIPDVKWNTYNLTPLSADGFLLLWIKCRWWDENSWECCMNVGAGMVKVFIEPRPWFLGICPDERWREDLLQTFTFQFSFLICVCVTDSAGHASQYFLQFSTRYWGIYSQS